MTDKELIAGLRDLAAVLGKEAFTCAADRIEQLAVTNEALTVKLAKAVGTLELIQIMDTHELLDIETLEPCDEYIGTCGRLARDTLAEIKGDNHDKPTTEK